MPAYRSLSDKQPLLHEARSRTGMAAQLFRLFGLAMTADTKFMATAVLRAAGSQCDFGSERRAECLAAMAEIAADPGAPVMKTVEKLLHSGIEATCMRDAVAALDVALTLLEAAAQCNPFPHCQSEEAASLFKRAVEAGPHVVGRDWLPQGARGKRVMHAATAVVLTDLRRGAACLHLDPQLPANLRRMAVASATFV